MTDLQLVKAFRDVDALKELATDAHEILIPFSALRSVRKGETLFCQGEPSPYCFGVLSGEVTVTFKVSGGEPIATENVFFGPGALLGGLSLLGELPRPGLAIVSQDGQLLSIWSSRFRKWTDEQRSLAGDPPILNALRHVLQLYGPR